MPKIKILKPELINKIAAGEVVEGPAQVVKELIENALDAQATQIKVEIRESGFKLIKVSDNGVGMDKADLGLSIEPHATSKILDLEDLFHISSLGFRGEALASISEVSDFVIQSRAKDQDIGVMLDLQAGQKNFSEIAMNQGTIVTVKNLFSKTPARLRFMSSKDHTFRTIAQIITNFALIFTQVSFELIHNQKQILRFLANDTIESRLRKILGADFSAQLLQFEADFSYSKIKGFISRPQLNCKNRSKEYLFINNRFIRHPQLMKTVKEVYGSLLSPHEYPVFVIFLELPPENLDVNIHPRKEEVKIYNQKEIVENLRSALDKTLRENNLIYNAGDFWEHKDGFDKNSARVLRKNSNIWSLKELDYDKVEIIQIDKTYLITQNDQGLLIFDQHAVHERILFEEFKKNYDQVRQKITKLEPSLVFELPKLEANFLSANLRTFFDLGFLIEDFGLDTFKLIEIPEFFQARDLEKLLRELLDDLMFDRDLPQLDTVTEKTFHYLACRSAVKAGDYLSEDERRRLLQKLSQTSDNYSCPHGRPNQIQVSLRDLEKMFKRR